MKSLFDIFNKILHVLDACGDSDEIVFNPQQLSLLKWDTEVCHQSRVHNQALDATQALSEGEEFQSTKESFGSLDVSLDVKRYHRSRTAGLLLAKLIIWEGLEAWINYAVDLGMILEEGSDLLCDRDGTLDFHCKSLGSSECETAVEGEASDPTVLLVKNRQSKRSFSLSVISPITTSEWPPMYLVIEWTTKSAPRSRGF